MHLIHVGNMANKGTQALLKSDISLIKDTIKRKVVFSVSTTDIEGVEKLNLSLDGVFPPMVDIPYERADSFARKLGFSRGSWRYNAFAFASLILMFIQTFLSVFSAVLVKIGLRPFYRADFLERVKDCGVVISYSDENFKESASMLPMNIYWALAWWTMLISRTWDVLIAKFLGKPLVMFPNSIGPFRTWIGRTLARLALKSYNYILVREPVSYKIIDSFGIKVPKILTADTSLLLTAVNKGNKTFLDGTCARSVMGVSAGFYSHSLSKKEVCKYIEVHAKALDAAIEKHGFFVVFLPHYVSGFRYDDLEVTELILDHMQNKDAAKIVNAASVEEFKSILSQMDIVISSKMHPAVLAVAAQVPTVCIAYDHKQTGFFEQIGMVECVLPVRSITYETLLSRIEYVWSRKSEFRASLKGHIPLLQGNIRTAAKRALAPFIK